MKELKELLQCEECKNWLEIEKLLSVNDVYEENKYTIANITLEAYCPYCDFEEYEISFNINVSKLDLSKKEDQMILNLIDEYIEDVNERICEVASKLNKDCIGTTLALIIIYEDYMYIYNLGDSRIYFISKDEIIQLSKDHTKAQMLYKSGIISKDEMKSSPSKNILTQYLGISTQNGNISPYKILFRINKGDRFLICSDGVSDLLNDNEIEKTITEQIYADLVPVEQTLKNITIVDYFPQYIIDNFEMAYVEGMDALKISSEIDKETNSITWTIPELKAKETLKVQYTLTLKDEFNEKIIDQILDTNQKVEINYKDFDNTEKTTESTVTPKLKLTAIKAEEPKTEPTITKPTKDETKAPEELPKTGAPILFGFITVATVSTITFAVKSKKFNF